MVVSCSKSKEDLADKTWRIVIQRGTIEMVFSGPAIA